MIDAFKIGVSLAFESNADSVLSRIMKDLLGLDVAASKLRGSLGSVKDAAKGAIMAFAGFATIKGLADLVTHAENLNTQLALLHTRYGGNIDLKAAQDVAFRTQLAVPTSDAADNVKVLGELTSQLSSQSDAALLLPEIQRLTYLVSTLTDEKDNSKTAVQVMKFADLSGQLFSEKDGKQVIDPAKFAAMATVMERLIAAGNGLLTVPGLLAFAKQAGVPMRTLTPDKLSWLGEAMIAMGESRAGTAETSLFSQLAGGIMMKRTALEMEKWGLLHPGEFEVARGGQIVVAPEATHRLGKLAADPEALINDLSDKFAKAHMSQMDITLEMFKLFGRQTTQRLMAELMLSGPQIARFRTNFAAAPGVDDAYGQQMSERYRTNMDALTASWNALTAALGNDLMPMAITGLHGLTDVVQGLEKGATTFPGAAKALLEMVAALSAYAALSGSLKVANAALALSNVALRALGVEAPLAAGGLTVLQGAVGRLSGMLAAGAKFGLAGLAAHEALSLLPDPGPWIDRHLPGASWLDNAASKLGVGRSYSEQGLAPNHVTTGGPPKPAGTASDPLHVAAAAPLPITGQVDVGNTRALSSSIDQSLAKKATPSSVGQAMPDWRDTPNYGGGF